jgi:hypothetical protein
LSDLISHRSLFSSIVQVKVGQAGQVFTVHKDLLCEVSSFYDSSFNGGFLEASTGIVVQEYVTPETFSLFLQFLYSGEVIQAANLDKENRIKSDIDLFALYVFADFISVSVLKNAIIDALLRWKHSYQVVAYVEDMFEKLMPDDPMLKLIIDLHVHVYTAEDLENSIRLNHQIMNFCVGVVAGLKSKITKSKALKASDYYSEEPEGRRTGSM